MSISAEKLYEPVVNENEEASPKRSIFTKVVSTAVGGVIAAPGIALGTAGYLTNGILKFAGATLELVTDVALLPLAVPSKVLLDVAKESDESAVATSAGILGIALGLPCVGVGIPVMVASGILKGVGFVANLALNIATVPFIWTFRKILKKGNPELEAKLQEMERQEEIENEIVRMCEGLE